MYSKFLKKRNEKTKEEYQDYKKLFDSIKKRSKIGIPETESIAQSFNKYFTQIGSKLANDIGTSTKSFNEYIKKHDTT